MCLDSSVRCPQAKIVPDLGGGNAYFTAFVDQLREYAARREGCVRLDRNATLGIHVELDATIILGDRSQGFTFTVRVIIVSGKA